MKLTFLFAMMLATSFIQAQIIPPLGALSNYTLPSLSATMFHDPSGPGGNPCLDAPVAGGNYTNCNCFTTIRINAAAGEFVTVDFSEFAMWNTTSGWDWMKIYDGPNTGSPILYDNSSTGPNNPFGDCGIGASILFFCSTSNSLTFEFWATSVVNRAGWDATLSSVSSSCGVLPIELIAFEGSSDNGSNLINWTSASEVNNDYYTLERSTDGEIWQVVSRINGAGYSTIELNYEFVDETFIDVSNLYRLTQTDFNGTEKVYDIITIDNSQKTDRTLVKIVNLMGQEVNEEFNGVKLYLYDDNTIKKVISQ